MEFKQCFISSCGNTSESNPSKIFLSVPQNIIRRKMWFEAVGQTHKKSVLYCCEDHFNLETDAENWIQFKLSNVALRLKSTIVPRVVPFPRATLSQLTPESRKRKRDLMPKEGKWHVSKKLFQNISPSKSATSVSFEEEQLVSVQLSLDKACQADFLVMPRPKEKPKMVNKGVNVSITLPRHVPTSSSGSWETSASVYSVETDVDKQIMLLNNTMKNIWEISMKHNSRFYLGFPKETYCTIKYVSDRCNVTIRNICIVLKKVRMGDSFKRLGHDFGISTSYTTTIFSQSVKIIASVLNGLIIWPAPLKIKLWLPISFRKRYNRVQSIIDAFEVEVEKPSNPIFQSLTWSSYKHCNTIKVLISITPCGDINFISPAYAGRISDKKLVEISGYLDVLPKCTVMADRGFKHITALLSAKQCTLVRPPSVGAGEKPSAAEVQTSKQIAALRVHVERAISRIREFKLLGPHSLIDHNLIDKIDYCVIIAAAIVNLQGPLIL